MRVTYPTGWNSFTREQKTAWWQKNVEKPMQEVMQIVEGRGGLDKLTNDDKQTINSAFDKPKTIAEELAAVKSIFGTAERERRREARKWDSELDED